jgi:hypothetical protein
MSAGPEWGPLARLAGVWEGEQGEDLAFSNEKGSVGITPYREHTEFKPARRPTASCPTASWPSRRAACVTR